MTWQRRPHLPKPTPGKPAGSPAARYDYWRRLQFEWLEERQLLSVAQPVGIELRANTFTIGSQSNAKVASDAAGDSVVVWNSYGEDGYGFGIYGQRYNANDAIQGTEFRINSYTTNNQTHPSVAMDSAGDFVVAWQSSGEDGNGYGIYAQRYNKSGAAQGTEFLVNTYTTNGQLNPTVAMDSAGDFIIAWQSSYEDGSAYGIYAQLYNAGGTAQGSEFRVNTDTVNNQASPAVAMDSAGDFVVAWQSIKEDGALYGVYAQRYSVGGVAQGSEFQVNTFTTGDQAHPAVAMDSAGDFLVAWQSYGEDGNQYGIYAQRYTAGGITQGTEYLVNTYTTGMQRFPTVAMDSAGDSIVAWQSYGEDGSLYGVYAQRYDATGLPQQSEFLVNTYTTGNQAYPAVAMDSAGDFSIAWQSGYKSGVGEDGSNYGVYVQRYAAIGTPPVIKTTSSALNYTAQSGPQTIDPGVKVTDTESPNIVSATVTISSGYDPAHDTVGYIDQDGIVGTLNSTTGTLVLNGTAILADYQAYLESITFACSNVPASTNTRTVSIEVNDGTNYSNTASRTINLLDSGPATQLILATQPAGTVAAGTGFGFTVEAEDALGNVAGGFSGNVTVALATNPGNSTLGGTLTVAAASGLAVFSGLTLNEVSAGYTLNITSGSLASATSSAISVVPGAATQLILQTQPPGTISAGTNFGLTVVAEDADGNLATGFTSGVTVALANNPGSSTLAGTSTISASAGVAVFPSLNLNKVGTGYTLSVTSPALASATTSGFQVIPKRAHAVCHWHAAGGEHYDRRSVWVHPFRRRRRRKPGHQFRGERFCRDLNESRQWHPKWNLHGFGLERCGRLLGSEAQQRSVGLQAFRDQRHIVTPGTGPR